MTSVSKSRVRSFVLSALAVALVAGTAAAQAVPPAAAPARPAAKPVAPQAAATPAPAAPAAPVAAKPVARPVSSASPDVIARIGGIDVKADEIRALVASLGEREQAALESDPALLSQTVRNLLATKLVLKEAQDKKWEQRPDVAERLKRLQETAVVESYLAEAAKVPADYPPEADVRATYDANKSAFAVPRQFQVAQIFVAGASDADRATLDAARKKVAEITARLKQPGADFGAVARDLSDSRQTAERGGEVGWIAETQMRPELRPLLLGLAKHGVTDPVQLEDGWHILELIDSKPASTRPYEEVRDQLVLRMREERAAQLRRAYLAELLRKTPPVINEFGLAKAFEDGKAARP